MFTTDSGRNRDAIKIKNVRWVCANDSKDPLNIYATWVRGDAIE